MKNLTCLSKEELTTIEGGTFAFDAGWFIANSLVGNFFTLAGTSDALMDYAVHYATE